MIDGPFAETKEQLLGFYIIDTDLDEAVEVARDLGPQSRRRLRDSPGRLFFPDQPGGIMK